MKTLLVGLMLMSATLPGQNRPGNAKEILAVRDRKPAPIFACERVGAAQQRFRPFAGKSWC